MTVATESFDWGLFPGDYVIAEHIDRRDFRILHRSANDLEAQGLVAEFERQGRAVFVFQLKGTVP